MPVHDWTRVDAGIFHHFHHGWIEDISRALNRGLLPPEYYALAEQIAGGVGPDVLTLHIRSATAPAVPEPAGGVAVATAPPRVQFRLRRTRQVRSESQGDRHSARQQSQGRGGHGGRVAREQEHAARGARFRPQGGATPASGHSSADRRSVSAGASRSAGPAKAHMGRVLRRVRIRIAARSPADARRLHCRAGTEALIEPTGVGAVLVDMPLFLIPEVYVPIPLEATYQSAWEAVPAYWRDVLSANG